MMHSAQHSQLAEHAAPSGKQVPAIQSPFEQETPVQLAQQSSTVSQGPLGS